jgi:P4 family phage/plasmid primase-like protien
MAPKASLIEKTRAVAEQIAPLLVPGQIVELRVPKVDGRKRTDSGYFDNLHDLAEAAARYSGRAPGVYMTMNPVNSALFHRSNNRMVEYADMTTSDADIVSRHWLLIDADPVRPAGVSSSDAEHELALARANAVRDWLASRGWPDPVLADSGNGAHLNYRLDLPNDKSTLALIEKSLQALAMTFDDGDVRIDTSVANAARIWKVYGTAVCKGAHTDERPHRIATVMSVPPDLKPVSAEMLQALAQLVPEADEEPRGGRRRGMRDFDLEAWIAEHRLPVSSPRTWGSGGKRWVFDVCPWNSDHADKSAFIVQLPGGAIAAGCQHNSCQGKDWHALRELYDGPAPTRRHSGQEEKAGRKPQINRESFDPLAYRAEDGGVLDAWCDLYAHQWLYATGWNIWLQWCATHWQRDETLRIRAQVEGLLDDMNLAAKAAAGEAAAEMAALGKNDDALVELEQEAARYKALISATKRTKDRVASVVGLGQARRAVHSREFDVENSLNLLNGTLDLSTFELRPHTSESYLTYVLPYAYDPDAKAPRWEKYLRDVLVREDERGKLITDEEMILLYQELWGYSLTPYTNRSVIVFQAGEGGNGKSVAIAVLNALLGEHLAMTLDFAKLGRQGNYDTAQIPGKRVLLSTESAKGSRIPEDILKTISDGEPLRSRAPYQDTFEFRPVGKIWWSMNHLPHIRDTTTSIWRRMKLIPFRRQFSEKAGTADVNLTAKLKEELPGILNWALLGLERLNAHNRFTRAEAVDAEVDQYRTSSNPTKLWLEERCEPAPAPMTKPNTLYDDYLRWCETNGYDRDSVVNSREFAQELRRLGYPSRKLNVGLRYPLILRSQDAADDDE